MKNLVLVCALAGVVGCGGGSPSPKEACEQLAAALCAQYYGCLNAAEITAAGLPVTEAACVTTYQTTFGCAATTVANACDGNQVYHGDKADTCVSQVEGLECSQIRDQNFDFETAAPACDQVCTVP